jgi:hypothetical protein
MSDEQSQNAGGPSAVDMQLFQLATITAQIDHMRFRIHHLEVVMKGEKAGPYEASQIPPPLTTSEAFHRLRGMWLGCIGEGPEVDEVLMGHREDVHEEGEHEPGGEPRITVPSLDEAAFELDETPRQKPKPSPEPGRPRQPKRPVRRAAPDDVVELQPEEADADDSDVIELE